MKQSLLISVILLTQISIIPQKGDNGTAPPAYIGVRERDWVEYSHSFYYENPDTFERETKIVIYENEYKTTVRILDVTGTNMTFEEDRRCLNGSIALLQTITGNPNEPHFQHPLFRINDLFIPAGLEAGDNVPQTLAFPDSQDNYVPVPWTQYINETLEKTYLGIKRDVNHIFWEHHCRGNSSDGKKTFEYCAERDAYYDKDTGVMLQWFFNESKMVRRKDTGKEYVLVRTYDYKVSDTNLWSTPQREWREDLDEVVVPDERELDVIWGFYGIAGLGIVIFLTIWIKRDWLFESIVGLSNG